MRADDPGMGQLYAALRRASGREEEAPAAVVIATDDDQKSAEPHRITRRGFAYAVKVAPEVACAGCRWFCRPDTCGLYRHLGRCLPDAFALDDKVTAEAGCAAFEGVAVAPR